MQDSDAGTEELFQFDPKGWGKYRTLSTFDDDNNETTVTDRFAPYEVKSQSSIGY
jgi:hypothetical protein